MPDKKQPKPKQTPKREPIVVTNPKDPRLKAYSDSLRTYNNLEEGYKRSVQILNNSKTREEFATKNMKMMASLPTNDNLLFRTEPQNIGKKSFPDGNQTVYRSYGAKSPIQPVVYQKPQNKSTNYTLDNVSPEDIKTIRKLHEKPKTYNAEESKTWDRLAEKYNFPSVKTVNKYGLTNTQWTLTEEFINSLEKRVNKPQEQKDFPLRGPLPKAQAKVQITPGQVGYVPEPQGQYLYGPANSVIGTYDESGNVMPYNMPEQRGKVNQADLELLNNKDTMKKYVQAKGLKMGKGGKLKAAWGASLGTDQFISGPDPVNPYPQGFKIPKLDAQGNVIPDTPGVISGSGLPENPVWQNPAPLQGVQPVPTNPNQPKMYELDHRQTGFKAAPGTGNVGEGALNRGQVPDTPAADKQAINPNKTKGLGMPEGGAGGGFVGQIALGGLNMASALMKSDRKRRRYLRPEDLPTYNPNQYGTGSQALSEYGNTLKGKEKAAWGAVIGAVAGQSGLKPAQGLHNNINQALLPLMTISNNRDMENQRLDNMQYQNIGNLQQPVPIQQQWAYMKNGGEMSYKHGGELQTGEGGVTRLKSYNPFDGGTFQFNGDSHSQGGIDIAYKGQAAEVEGGETAFKDQQGDLKIMGNLKVPGTNMKYKTFSKQLADKEKKAQKLIDKGTVLVDTADPKDPFELLAFNSGKAMMTGGLIKQKQLSDMKQHLGNMQEAHLEVAKENKKSPEKLFAAKGATLSDDPKPKKKWTYKDADVKNVDPAILTFADMLAAKGIEGYTGARGGYRSGSKTTSGRKSRHARNQALDLIPVDGQVAYNKILNDPELVNYLMTNGLTVIDEYDPQTAKKTGATAGHLHIGRDKGTKTADKFRNDVASLYPQFKGSEPKYKMNDALGQIYTEKELASIYGMKPSDIKARIKSGILTPIQGVSSQSYMEPALNQGAGDAYTENTSTFVNKPYNVPQFNYTPKPTNIQTVQGDGTPIELQQPKPFDKPSNARGISPLQFMGEAMAMTEQVEPVQAQLYYPDLFNPYQVSFQDRLNENQATFNNIQKQLAYDPTALSTLAAQEYGADSAVLADEFRTNQGIANEITNKNVALLNEAKKTNLQILDTQMVRQETAKSKTRENKQAALSSISSKLLQKEASNNQLRVLEQLYPHYAFDKKTGRAGYYGETGAERAAMIDTGGLSPVASTPNRTRVVTDPKGAQTTTQYYDNPVDQFMKSLNLQEKKLNLYKPKSVAKYWNEIK